MLDMAVSFNQSSRQAEVTKFQNVCRDAGTRSRWEDRQVKMGEYVHEDKR